MDGELKLITADVLGCSLALDQVLRHNERILSLQMQAIGRYKRRRHHAGFLLAREPPARVRETLWLVRRYGPPMPPGPLRMVRPRTRAGYAVAGAMGALAMSMGGTEAKASKLMRLAVELVEPTGPSGAKHGSSRDGALV